MKIRQLEYFCAVAEEKSISAAARELHVAQPPISRQIAQLEEELGVQLFLRGSKGMSLTDAGQSLYQQTQQIFQDIRRVEDSVRSVGTGMSGRIKLGVIYSAMSYALHYINEYHSRYPQVELFIRVGSPQELIESLNRGELHALFLRTAAREPSGLQERILGEDKLELIMREDLDPAPELNEVPIERLEGVPMCLLRSDDLWSYNDFLVQECQRSGFTPNVTCHCYDRIQPATRSVRPTAAAAFCAPQHPYPAAVLPGHVRPARPVLDTFDGRNAFAGLSCSHTLRHLLLATTTHTTTRRTKLLFSEMFL